MDCVAPSNDVAVSNRKMTRLDAEEISVRLLKGYPRVEKVTDPVKRTLLREFLAGRARTIEPELRAMWEDASTAARMGL